MSAYLNPKLTVGACRDPRLGRGLFAKESIRRGEVLLRHEGKIIVNGALKMLPPECVRDWCYDDDADDNASFCPLDCNTLTDDWLFNHPCSPNAGSAGEAPTQVAMRTIEAGEEVTIDYALIGSEADWTMECFCGMPNCRSVVTGRDWLLPELQERYRGYFQKNIQANIDAMKSAPALRP